MQVVEILIYFIIAFIIGGMIMGFIVDWDYSGVYDTFKQQMLKERNPSIKEITQDDFISNLISYQGECLKTEHHLSRNFYILGDKNITKKSTFDDIKNLSMCTTLASLEYDCGEVETFTAFPTITPPSIITIECENNTLMIS